MALAPYLVRIRGAQIKSGALFLANFGLSKLSVYFIPILIAAVAPAPVYGGIEFAWAVGMLGASLIVGAPLSGVTQRYVVRGDREVGDEIALITGAGALAGVAIWGVLSLFGAGANMLIAAASFGVAVVHSSSSTIFRMSGRRNLTAWADGTATLVAGAIVLTAYLTGGLTVASVTLVYGVAGVAVGAIALIIAARMRMAGLRERMRSSFAIGMPMLAGSVLAMWLGVGGRMMVGVLDAAHVAAYSFAFRVAGLSLGIHQLAITALFARIYGAKTKHADAMLFPFLIAVGALTALIVIIAPIALPHFRIDALAGGGEVVFARIIPIVGVQVFFWIAFAMLQMRVNRSGLAVRVFMPMLWVTMAGTAAIVGAHRLFGLGIVGLCWGISLQAAAFFAVEWVVLARRGLPHRLVGWAALGGGGLLSVIALVTQAFQGPLP